MSTLRCFILAFAVSQLTIGEERTSCVSDPSLYATMPFKCDISWPPAGDGALEICGEMVAPKRRLHIWLETSNSANVPLNLEFIKNHNLVQANSREGGGERIVSSGRGNWGTIISGPFPADFKIKKVPFCVLVTEQDDAYGVGIRYEGSNHTLLNFPDRELGVPSKLKVAKHFNISFAGMAE